MSRIAVVGLGNMGGPMAANLVAAGHDVTGYDPVPAAQEAAAAAGVSVAVSGPAAVADAAVVLTMLPTGEHVLAAWDQLLPVAPAAALFVDCSTIDVASSRAAHQRAAASSHPSVDAPVSGGVVGAEAGTLTFMAGGEQDALAAAGPVLDVLGKRTVHCGGPGAGQVAKMCNNMVLGVSMIAVSEAFVLAERLGLDPQALYDVASTSSGQCWALTTNCPVPGPVPASPANRDFSGGFAAQLMLKDLRLAEAAAAEAGVELALGRRATERYSEFTGRDDRVRDFSAIITDIRKGS
ncbi:3-hydroxyisobutyrate dehydrogenase [Pseudonocardia sp. Ae168_Ps1]|uniref:3-hydroxyisobutyrate dehydrogenase n=1 Tax=unclassified Pseudonocardia TaxID=2619320 RepID=UPI00094B68B1|nr:MULTISPECIES: 3-hydroxyisobutyrate dehydrogenase [unclassified Pseudonocardia]OLL74459.1 3-hydroxyisobutyrate dehydrogenase [Pseudonocardia sp. Ae150A_Ps1]OLL80439.1 3-hydroxyisobutyrate dehydrogenase [Pseudonocardia sp. Ae168_Ps1]OLL85434.1 3-hydroxyisobutyrate dehydrogenase [Pseudonocardia sp. Ae263_Ps1]OLL94539.1 3-hydroxyisobutyrate dehydrogenase [Pseudonocardia sp. Ae356_Ps1]